MVAVACFWQIATPHPSKKEIIEPIAEHWGQMDWDALPVNPVPYYILEDNTPKKSSDQLRVYNLKSKVFPLYPSLEGLKLDKPSFILFLYRFPLEETCRPQEN